MTFFSPCSLNSRVLAEFTEYISDSIESTQEVMNGDEIVNSKSTN